MNITELTQENVIIGMKFKNKDNPRFTSTIIKIFKDGAELQDYCNQHPTSKVRFYWDLETANHCRGHWVGYLNSAYELDSILIEGFEV